MSLKIKECIRVENNVTHTSVRAKLYQIKMYKNESVTEFNRKFDDIV